jgi:hypothetical protein
MDDHHFAPAEVAARTQELYNQITELLENEIEPIKSIVLTSLFLDLITEICGDEARKQLEEIFGTTSPSADTRWMNALVDKGYDWPTRIGKAKKAGK